MNPFLQRLKSRTYWAALVLAALTIIEAQYAIVAAVVPPKWGPYMPLIFPVAMMFFREITKTALEDK